MVALFIPAVPFVLPIRRYNLKLRLGYRSPHLHRLAGVQSFGPARSENLDLSRSHRDFGLPVLTNRQPENPFPSGADRRLRRAYFHLRIGGAKNTKGRHTARQLDLVPAISQLR